MPNVGRSDFGHFRDASAWQRYRAAYDRAMAELPTPAEVSDVPTAFGTVRAYRFGTDPRTPLLLLPGRSSATPMWGELIPALSRDRTVYAIDLIGEPGLSVQSRGLTSSPDQAAWLDELIAGLQLPAVHAVGVSIGGWLAFNLAVRVPGRLASVILLEPAMTFGRVTWKVVVLSLGAVLPVPVAVRERMLSTIAGGAPASAESPVAALVAAGMRDFKAKLPTPTFPTDDQVAAVDIPVLVVIGGRSVIHVPRAAADRARRLLRHGRVEFFPAGSHNITGEYPAEIVALVDGFLSDPGRTLAR
jgi:pimeloyl-ACP methyl ester carboxylesterase